MKRQDFLPHATIRKDYIDVETGEVKTYETTEPVKQRKWAGEKSDEEFIMVFPSALRHFAPSLTGAKMTLLVELIDKVDPRSGEARYTLRELAQALQTNETYVSRMIREMTEAAVLVRIGRGRVFVHPALGWRGSLSARRALIKKLKAPTAEQEIQS